ncbi:UDP-glucose 4-epimerase [Wickerhamomyces ciferrii]|uniref:UDP-glucose 4-epimerase n=1 Tax=Wickerhamomyces ciferrii (strain ATCC 14091 / BCRC 22168 / CBS 111 / JCM 3599 / NBRC 0793 / NRRL Y-1031 F-60-10) TaxID=1206466 RepID=K0KTJ5_WICCF|nr:UDP-glucose 4-epimerase [Wickerhamomyces ciferrii]CCH44598.1 UDP-glucose 4-epimerase [Wickerhamomyces ciferrii]
MSEQYILVTGGAGYIGSHTVIELIQNGYKVVIVDNLINSSFDAVSRIEFIVGEKVPFFNVDLKDEKSLTKVFETYSIKSVIHFAALKAVGESTKIPLDYYDNNVNGTITLLKVMNNVNVKTIVFSSSATVYGDATRFENMIPIPEHCPNDPTNPYGKTKYVIEQIIHDLYNSDPEWRAAILRYFNPIGAHPSGLIGEDPLGIPNNLLPYLAQVAIGRREKLSIFGNDYNSHDGTPIRDYIHVVDLAKGHIASLSYLNNLESNKGLFREWNLGTGKGSTVFDVYHAFSKAVGRDLPYEVVGRRAGDVLDLTANPTRANTELEWFAEKSIEDACKDLWRWTTKNPFGFQLDNYKWTIFGEIEGNRLHTVDLDGFKVSITNYGATIQNIELNGDKLVLGFDNLESYQSSSNPFFGATVGRYANRIGNGGFTIDGKSFKTEINESENKTLHGGSQGFDKKQWLGPIVLKEDDNSVSLSFKYIDPNGSNGFPSDLETIVKYIVSPKNTLTIDFESQIVGNNGDVTALNLTNHSYFTLGDDVIDEYQVELSTPKYLALDSNQLPTGETKKLDSTSFKFGSQQFDDDFIINEANELLDTRSQDLKTLVNISSSSHSIKVSSTEPAFQLYTGDGIFVGEFKSRAGFAVEPSRPVNAINSSNAKQVILRKGETYGSKIQYEFA